MKTKLLIVACVLIFFACDRPNCNNTNSIFNDNQPRTENYKKELANQLNTIDKAKLRYWLQDYKVDNNNTYLYFYIQGDGLCATLPLQITK